MFKLAVILGFSLIATIFADLESDELDTYCSAEDGKVVQIEWQNLWEESDSHFKVAFAKDILLEWEKNEFLLY